MSTNSGNLIQKTKEGVVYTQERTAHKQAKS